MSPTSPSPAKYYEGFEYGGGWDLSLMISALENLELPAHVKESVARPSEATFLVMGSATTRNIGNIAVLDSKLRPGKSHNDCVLMIDRNLYPMSQHQREWNWLRPIVHGEGDQQDHLPYPNFIFAQADMRNLPLPDESCDVVISDYTLNFLDTREDVARTFGQTQRVLKPGGVMLLAVAGHEDVDPAIPLHDLQDTAAQQKGRTGDLVTTQFPLQVYEQSAALNGLILQTAKVSSSTYLCAILQKQSIN